jgi:hypothetical protein
MPYPHGVYRYQPRGWAWGLSAQTTAATMQLHQTIERIAGRDSLIHSRLALLQLISEVAEAFQEERITASHANPITQLPQRTLRKAFAQCWWND